MKATAQSKTTTSLTSMDARSGYYMPKNPTILSVSICGSYHRHLKKMHKIILECKKLGIEVHIPRYPVKKSSVNGFVFLKGEKGSPKQLQEKNFDAIARSSFLLVVNTNGYIGSSTAMEIGYAIA